MRLFFFAPLAALVCLAASPARAADDAPVILEPSSQWVVNFAEDHCRLTRTFGGEGNRHVLFFEQSGPSAWFGFTVAGPQLRRFGTARIKVRFGAHPVNTGSLAYTGSVENFGSALIYSRLKFAPDDSREPDFGERLHSLPEIGLAQAAMVSNVSVRQGKREIIFETGKLTEPVNVLNQCAQNLLISWKLDLDRHRTATRLPVWTNGIEVAKKIQANYPESALQKGEQAILHMRAIIDETGKVAECATVKATIAESFNSVACNAMKIARFEPALDQHGQPMRSFYITTISYKIN